MSNKIKPWRKKDKKHFRYPKKKKLKFEKIPDDKAPRYEVVDGEYVRVK